MIKNLRIGNFKAFAETQDVPIRPLTLIYGPNSAGKSSVIHSLAWAHHAIATGELDTHRTDIGGESIDLGGFRQFVYRRDSKGRVEWNAEIDASTAKGRLAELLAPVKSVRMSLMIGLGFQDDQQLSIFGDLSRKLDDKRRVRVETFDLTADNQSLLSMSARRDGRLRMDTLDRDHPVFKTLIRNLLEAYSTTEALNQEDWDAIAESIDALVPELWARAGKFLPHIELTTSREEERSDSLLIPISKGKRGEDLSGAVRLFLPRAVRDLVDGLSELIAEGISRLRYLGPLRSYPPRHLAFSPHHDSNWFAGGGYAWDVLRYNDEVRTAVNSWLSDKDKLQTPYEIIVRDLAPLEQLEGPLHDALANMEERLKIESEYDDDPDEPTGAKAIIEDVDLEVDKIMRDLNEADIDRFPEIILMDRRSETAVSHRDVGIGVSQVLPVLVSAYSFNNQLVAIEQPEIHLHPKLQAELGDVFISSALGEQKNTFLLETHSEHLLLRIMKRMRQTASGTLPEGLPPIHPKDVAVLYVEPDGSRSIIRTMPLNERGELAKAWPGGFFEEGLREIF